MPASKKPSSTGASRYGRPATIGALSGKLASPVLDKRGFASGAVIGRWPEIVGHELAAFAVPLEIKFPRHRNDRATLVLQVASGGAATLLQLKTPQLLERINRFLGYEALSRVESHQGPLPRRAKAKPAPEPALTPEDESRINQKVKNIVSSDLRVALEKLGAAVARRNRSGGKSEP
ncbi:MAG: DUF721 domain-containing protein [Rhodospirillaceae bacterium]|nr:DUF721 domain-containing protein [Rhodospirillaceae bacterium]